MRPERRTSNPEEEFFGEGGIEHPSERGSRRVHAWPAERLVFPIPERAPVKPQPVEVEEQEGGSRMA